MKRKNIDRYFVLLFVLAAAVVAAYYGLEKIFEVDFICTNGDYQNYNVLKRFVDGQIPYKEFSNYLGMGVLYMCAPLVKLFNSLAGSMFVTNMMASFMFIIYTSVVFYIVTGNKAVSCTAGLIMPKLMSSGVILKFVPIYGYYINYYLTLMAYPNNSFRMCRMFLTVILSLVAMWYMKKTESNNDSLRDLAATQKGAAVIGLIAGLGVTWSNDFGFCSVGGIFAVMLVLTIADIFQKPKGTMIWKRFIWFFGALFAGMFLSIFIATQGHPFSWIEFTLGVSDWQYTYYGTSPSSKILLVSQMFNSLGRKRTINFFIIYIISMVLCLVKLIKNKANNRTYLFVFMFTTTIAAQILYIFGSGEDGLTETTNSFVIYVVFALVVKLLIALAEKINLKKYIPKAAACVAVLYVCFMGFKDVQIYNTYKSLNLTQDRNYVAELKGVNREADFLYDMVEMVGDDTLFSTYATAVDDMLDKFQPTGHDYVIHAMGDKQYEEYVDNLETGNYKWVQTTNIENWPWELWANRASWEVYKVIYTDYNIASHHGYWTMWQYAGEDANVIDADVKVSVNRIDAANIEIIVESQETQPCYVDVNIAWKLNKEKNTTKDIVLRRVVMIRDKATAEINYNFEGYFLKNEGENRNIPIYMENGKGSVIISSLPETASSIQLISAQAENVIRAQM